MERRTLYLIAGAAAVLAVLATRSRANEVGDAIDSENARDAAIVRRLSALGYNVGSGDLYGMVHALGDYADDHHMSTEGAANMRRVEDAVLAS